MEKELTKYINELKTKLGKYLKEDILEEYVSDISNMIVLSNDDMSKVASTYLISKVKSSELTFEAFNDINDFKNNYFGNEEKIILLSIIDLVCNTRESINTRIEKYCHTLDISLLDYVTLISEIERKSKNIKNQSLKLGK